MRAGPAAVGLLLAGCRNPLAPVVEAVDDVQAFGEPLVAGVLVVGIEDPELFPGASLLLAQYGLGTGTLVEAFLGSAKGDLLEDVAPEGGVAIVDGRWDAYPVPEAGDGVFSLPPGPKGPDYAANAQWRAFVHGKRTGDGAMVIDLPPPAQGELELRGQKLVLDVSRQDFNASLLVVAHVESGQLTWADVPSTLDDALDLLLVRDELREIVVPTDAFPRRGHYLVGIAALRHNRDDDLEGLNPILSRGTAGKMRIFEVEVE